MGFIALFFSAQSIEALAIPYFQMSLGIDPFLLALIMTVPIAIGAFISPWVGRLSDGFTSRWGRRKPFVLVGGWGAGLFFSLIWMVPVHWSHTWILWYFFVFSVLFYTCTAFLTINVRCLAYETSESPKQRTLVMAFTTLFERAGAILYFWLYPLAQSSIWGSLQMGVQVMGWLVGGLLIGLLSTMTAWLGQEKQEMNTASSRSSSHQCPQASARINKALNILLLLILLKLGLTSVCSRLDFYLLVYYVCDGDIAQGAYWKGVLSSAFAIFSFLLIPVFTQLSFRIGRVHTLIVIYVLSCLCAISKWFIYTPGHASWVILDACLGAASWVAVATFIPSMIAELCAKQRANSGQSHVGYFASAQNKIINISAVIAVVGSGLMLNLIGFDAEKAGAQSPVTLTSMRIILVGGSLLFSLLSIYVVRKYPFPDALDAKLTASQAGYNGNN